MIIKGFLGCIIGTSIDNYVETLRFFGLR